MVALDIENQVRRLSGKNIVELEQLRLLHEWLEEKRECRQPCRLVGDSRTGKSIAVKSYTLIHKPEQRSGQAPHVPVVLIQPPQNCGARELFNQVLAYLKFANDKGTTADIRRRAFQVLKDCGVEMLIIDEADRLHPRTFTDVRDVYDVLSIPVVLVGTDRLDALIKRDEQVFNRFCACYRFGVLSGEKFRQTVEVWERDILALPVASNLTSKQMLTILQRATRGYIGLMDMILRNAAIKSLKKGLTKIDLQTLQEVVEEYR